jgi:hypothetical protein
MTKYAIKIDMANTIEKFEKYIYTRYADTHLDLDSVIKWVLEFIDHPSFSPGTNVLWDATEIATTSLNFSDMAEFGDFLLSVRERRGGGRSGFVTNNDLVFGLFRTHEMLNNDKFDYDYRVFRDLSEARSWVASE